jgi:hypothetical protein
MRPAIFVLLLAAATLSPTWADITFKTISRTDLTILIEGAGSTVEDKSEDGDDPWLIVKSPDKRTFNLFMHECEKGILGPGRKCGQIRFKLFWDNDRKVTLETVNKFNLDYVFGRGFVTADGKSVGVDYALHLDGGVTRAFIRENMEYFLRVVEDFATEAKP